MGIKDFLRKLNKKENTIVDLGEMQRRGIYKPRIADLDEEESVIDLTSSKSNSSKSSKNSEEFNPLGFLGNLAAASSSPFLSNNENSQETEKDSSSEATTYLSSNQKQRLRGMLRDMKDRIDSTYSKIYNISERIDLIEKKIERLERRAGI